MQKCADYQQMPVECKADLSSNIFQKVNDSFEESSKSERYDEIGHWPYQDQKHSASRCKLPPCKNFTHVYCGKCERHLCFTRGRNCFVAYHKKN